MLGRHGYRFTQGRRRLLELVAAAGRPVTLPEVLEAGDLAQSSAYRNADVLERCGVLHRLVSGGDHAHFELAEPLLAHHHHLICVSCGRIEDVELDDDIEQAVDVALTRAARSAGFTPSAPPRPPRALRRLRVTIRRPEVFGRRRNCR